MVRKGSRVQIPKMAPSGCQLISKLQFLQYYVIIIRMSDPNVLSGSYCDSVCPQRDGSACAAEFIDLLLADADPKVELPERIHVNMNLQERMPAVLVPLSRLATRCAAGLVSGSTHDPLSVDAHGLAREAMISEASVSVGPFSDF